MLLLVYLALLTHPLLDASIPVFGDFETVVINHYESDDNLLADISGHWPVQRLLWF